MSILPLVALLVVGHDLPLVEVPASPASTSRFAVVVSGDGGWAKIDRSIAAELAAAGIPVVGLDSLKYFWTKKAPETLAADLATIIETYAARWKLPQVVLIGYSRGADVLPFAVSRLPANVRQRIALVALLSPSRSTTFDFRMTDWFVDRGGVPTAPEIAKLKGTRTICVFGTDDEGTVCPIVDASVARRVALTGAHHFDGDYPALAKIITSSLPQ